MACSAAVNPDGRVDKASHRGWQPWRHREMLIISLVALVLAPLLQVLPDQRVAFGGLGPLPLPATCLSQRWFHVSCPGCGLTRSLVLLAHGDLAGSFFMHRLGWLMALVLLMHIPYSLACLRARCPLLSERVTTYVGRMLIFLLMVNWVAGWFC